MSKDQANEVFNVLTTSYKALVREHSERQADRPFDELRTASRAFGGDADAGAGGPSRYDGHQPQPMRGGDVKGFNPKRFNEVFDTNRVRSAEDKGYEAWMKRHDPDTAPPRRPGEERSQVSKYGDPMAGAELVATKRHGGTSFAELGVDKVSDFSKPVDGAGGVSYTDYRLAHTRTRLMYEDEVTRAQAGRKDFRSLDDLRSHRAGQSFAMTAEDHRIAAAQQRNTAATEERRTRVLHQLDERAAGTYERSHLALLGYGRSASLAAAD